MSWSTVILALQQYLPLAVLKPDAALSADISFSLQQYLPLAVLKRYHRLHRIDFAIMVATALTVYGIETLPVTEQCVVILPLQQHLPFTVLKLETCKIHLCTDSLVATVLTVYGIETVLYRLYYGRYDP